MSKLPLLIDSFTFVPTLVEDKQDASGRLRVAGEFARADVPTENNRIYPRSLWEREIKRLAKPLSEKKIYGTSDHPENGRTSLGNVSHIITKLWLDGDRVMGEAEVLNTTSGQNIKAILEATGHLGVSSRGFGTTQPNNEGKDVVQDNYKISCFDFVADPANVTSYPTVQSENKEIKTGNYLPGNSAAKLANHKTEANMTTDKLTLESLRKSNPTVYENIMDDAERAFEKRGAEIWAKKIEAARVEGNTDLRTKFAEDLKNAINAAKAEVAEQEREKLMADPNVAGAKSALESLKTLLRPYIVPEDVNTIVTAKDREVSDIQTKLAESELAVANLKKENQELANLAKESGFRFHLETMLKPVPEHAELIRKTIGDLKTFESLDALNTRISDIVDEIKKVKVKQEERDTEMDRLKLENKKLQEATEKALEANKLMAVLNYAEERLRYHPKANDARMIFEAKLPESRDEVDEVLSKFREKKADSASLAEARARVKSMVGSNTVEYIKEHEELPRVIKSAKAADYNGLGANVESLRALSGMGTEEN